MLLSFISLFFIIHVRIRPALACSQIRGEGATWLDTLQQTTTSNKFVSTHRTTLYTRPSLDVNVTIDAETGVVTPGIAEGMMIMEPTPRETVNFPEGYSFDKTTGILSGPNDLLVTLELSGNRSAYNYDYYPLYVDEDIERAFVLVVYLEDEGGNYGTLEMITIDTSSGAIVDVADIPYDYFYNDTGIQKCIDLPYLLLPGMGSDCVENLIIAYSPSGSRYVGSDYIFGTQWMDNVVIGNDSEDAYRIVSLHLEKLNLRSGDITMIPLDFSAVKEEGESYWVTYTWFDGKFPDNLPTTDQIDDALRQTERFLLLVIQEDYNFFGNITFAMIYSDVSVNDDTNNITYFLKAKIAYDDSNVSSSYFHPRDVIRSLNSTDLEKYIKDVLWLQEPSNNVFYWVSGIQFAPCTDPRGGPVCSFSTEAFLTMDQKTASANSDIDTTSSDTAVANVTVGPEGVVGDGGDNILPTTNNSSNSNPSTNSDDDAATATAQAVSGGSGKAITVSAYAMALLFFNSYLW